MLKGAILLKDADSMIIRVRNDNFLVHPQAEAMWRGELIRLRAERAKLGANLHNLVILSIASCMRGSNGKGTNGGTGSRGADGGHAHDTLGRGTRAVE